MRQTHAIVLIWFSMAIKHRINWMFRTGFHTIKTEYLISKKKTLIVKHVFDSVHFISHSFYFIRLFFLLCAISGIELYFYLAVDQSSCFIFAYHSQELIYAESN